MQRIFISMSTVIALGIIFLASSCMTPDIRKGRTINLDTTYFPFGLDYEWCYERSADGDDANIYPPATWKYCDTFILVVTDSFWKDDTLCFKMQTKGKPKAFPRGYPRNWFRTPKGFDITNSARIIGNKIVFNSHLMLYLEIYTVKLIPDEYKEGYSLASFSISYSSDSTLDISYSTMPSLGLTSNDELPSYSEDIRVSRLKSIGTYIQNYYINDRTFGVWYEIRDRLLWFYNGRDTVFKAKK